MLAVLKQLLVLYLFLFLGWMFGGMKKDQVSHTGIISFLLVNLFLPCKVFGTFSKNFTVSYVTEKGSTIIFSVLLLLLLVAIALPLSKILTKDAYERKVFRYSIPISNYAYLGYVLIEEVFGETGLTNMILFCIPFAIYTYSFGYSMLTGKEKSFKKLINPMTVSIFLGMIAGLSGLQLPELITGVISSSSACVGPLSMILTGMTLAGFSIKKLVIDKKSYVFTAIRLLALPLFVFGVCRLLLWGNLIDETAAMSALIVSCMPCGLNPIIFPKLIGEDCTTGARLALLTHTFSCITLPIWISILM